MVSVAFEALKTPEPDDHDPNGDLLPTPKGRRQFISDLKAGQ